MPVGAWLLCYHESRPPKVSIIAALLLYYYLFLKILGNAWDLHAVNKQQEMKFMKNAMSLLMVGTDVKWNKT